MNDILDRILMLQMGHGGNTSAHVFLERSSLYPKVNAEEMMYRLPRGTRKFIAPKENERIVMFGDNSGIYVHADGFCTIMGSDISTEISNYKEIGV